jgi:tetratricopeptide (TPR) repeat protein
MRAWLAVPGLIALLLGGCSKDFGTTNMAHYYDAGLRAELGRDYQAAERHYERALVWAGTERVPPALLSLNLYNLGRMKGHGCKFAEANELLLTSLALEERTSGPASLAIARRLLELARLSYDRRLYAEALPYYAEAISMLRRLQTETEVPALLTESLQDYAMSLQQTGDLQSSAGAQAEAEALRARHPDAPGNTANARYTTACRGTTLSPNTAA